MNIATVVNADSILNFATILNIDGVMNFATVLNIDGVMNIAIIIMKFDFFVDIVCRHYDSRVLGLMRFL